MDLKSSVCCLGSIKRKNTEAIEHFEVCVQAVKTIKEELKVYIASNKEFKNFGERFLNIIEFSLEENLTNSYKEIPHGVL